MLDLPRNWIKCGSKSELSWAFAERDRFSVELGGVGI